MSDLVKTIDQKLNAKLISSKVMLSRFALLEESSRSSFAYTDPRHIPFFYYLGCQIKPKTFCEIGVGLGLCSGAFFLGCRTVEHFLGFQPQTDEYYSTRLAHRNIKLVYHKDMEFCVSELEKSFKKHKWDLVSITEHDEQMTYLKLAWSGLSDHGMIIIDHTNYTNNKAYHDFCKVVNRQPVVFKTKYGVGLIER